MYCQKGLVRNVQALIDHMGGDRFEVTLQDEMRPRMAWKDITDEAVVWLAEIWKA